MIGFKKHFATSFALMAALLTASAQQKLPKVEQKGVPVAAVTQRAGANVTSKTSYAWLTRDKGTTPKGIVSFDLSMPQTLTSMFELADKAYAGAYGIDKYYFYRYRDDAENQSMLPLAFSSVDLKTGSVTDIADWSNVSFICNDMTYDYSTGNIYAMCRAIYTDNILNFDIEYSKLIKIDPKTGVYTDVKDFLTDYSGFTNPTYLTLAADMEGNLYSINIAGQLVEFDKNNDYAEKIIGFTGFTPGTYLQCMEFDHSTDRLYWAADYKNRVSNFCIVDTQTGEATEIGNLGNDSRLAGLYIPFDMPANGAPAGASGLSVASEAEGGLSATLSWTNPTKTFDNKALTAINSVKVMRAGVLIKEFDSVEPGQKMTYTDADVPSNGLYEYSVVATNAEGTGKVAVKEQWVGRDVPAAVTKLGIESLADGSARLSWTAPSVGAHKGWLDSSSLKYRVTRYPDGTVVGEGVTGNEFVDNTVSDLAEYYYTVQSQNAEGDGYEARSASIFVGKTAQIPYSCAFGSKGEFASWYVVDNNNDGSTWEYKKLSIGGVEKGYAMYTYSNNNNGDDYLISPDFNLKKGHTYTLSFGYKAGNSTYKETFDVRIGQGRSAEAQQAVMKDYTVQTGDLAAASLQLPEITEDGTYNISFHATSPKGSLKLYITDVKLTDNNPTTDPDQPDVPGEKTAPKNLKAKVNDNGSVLLTWNTDETAVSDNIAEGFEDYNGFQINPTGKYEWNYIDADGGVPFYSFEDGVSNDAMKLPCAAMVIDSEQLAGSMVIEDNPPHAGKKYLMFRSNYSAADGGKAPVADDYFISPRLGFGSSFTFSFYAKSDPDSQEEDAEWKWDKEEMRVGYSSTGNAKDDFVWLTKKNVVVTSEWQQFAYTIPADAKYVCINYCTPSNGYLMCVDDVFIGVPASAGSPRRVASAPNEYAVYLDDVKVGSTTATSYELQDVAVGQHTAKVTAVYDDGETEPACVTFAVNPASAIDQLSAAGITLSYDKSLSVVNFGSQVDSACLYDAAGKQVSRPLRGATSVSVAGLPAGVYVLRINVDGKSISQKISIE